MLKLPHVASALVVTLLIAPPAAHAAFPSKVKAGDVELVLNGSGARTKYLMQLYEAGLYVAQPTSDGAAIIAADAPMAFRIEITSGLVSQEKLVESLNEGFTAATSGNIEPIRTEIEQFRKCFAAPIAKGDVFNLIYLPPHGVIVLKNGKRQGAIAGLAFKQALFAIWLGDEPADEALRLAMLGKSR
jgi:hypothetical protein